MIEKFTSIVLPSIPDTLYMVFFSSLFSMLIGIPLALVLIVTRPGGLNPKPKSYQVLDTIINTLRSFPFVILIMVVYPLSRLLIGKSIGPTAAIVPLTVAAIPFVARIMEGVFLEVDEGLVEAARAMGSTNGQILTKVILPESLPSIINSMTMTIINIIGYSAMAGMLGAGGLGEIATRYGHYRNQLDILWMSVICIIIIVQVVQWIGNRLTNTTNKK